MAKVKLASLLGKRKEKVALMDYQKTKNCRDRKKMEERVERRREASRISYMEKKKNKVKDMKVSVKKSQEIIKKMKEDIEKRNIDIKKEETKIARAESQIAKEMKKMKNQKNKK